MSNIQEAHNAVSGINWRLQNSLRFKAIGTQPVAMGFIKVP
jgi:hypothetical protein